jgi:putative oxidoreductase
MFDSIGVRPGKHNAIIAGSTETGGGALLILGAATPLAASALTATMLTAIHRVHSKNGPWNSAGGYEYNVVLIAAVLTLAELGPGPLSIDGRRRQGPIWALGALVTGVLGAVGANLFAARELEPVPAPPEQEASRNGARDPVVVHATA